MKRPGTRFIFAYGELHYETRAGYMRTLGPAILCRDGNYWLPRGNYWIEATQVEVRRWRITPKAP